MSKTKSRIPKGAAEATVLKPKDAGITKPSKSSKTQSKAIAKQVAAKQEKRLKSKKAKEPIPEPSDPDSESSASSDASDSSESESEAETKVPAPNGSAKTNGVAKGTHDSFDEESDEESESESTSSESSEDEAPAVKTASAKAVAAVSSDEDEEDESSDESEEEAAPKGIKAAVKAATAHRFNESESEEEDSDGSDESDREVVPNGAKDKLAAESSDESSEESESEDEAPAKTKAAVKAGVLTKKPKAVASDEESLDEEGESGDSEDSEESESSESEEEEAAAPPPKKRKADVEATTLAKKNKTEAATAADLPESGNLFVGNLSWNVDEEWLSREFEEFGELTGVRVVTDRNTGRSKGFGYVEFANPADAAKAHAAKSGADIDGRPANVDFATKKDNSNQGAFKERAQSRAQNFGDQASPESDTLFVGNLSFDVTQDLVAEAFAECGSILAVRLPTDMETGAIKGYGYVQFSSVDEARSALESMNGTEVAGRPIRLDFSTPRPSSGGSPRGGRGGRGGGRGGFGDRGGRGGGRGGFGGRGGGRGGRGGSTNRGGFGDYQGKKTTF